MKQTCSICSSPVLAEINNALAKGEKLRDLAKRTPFSRATLSRHHRACVPRTALANFKRFNPATDRVHVRWPNQPIPDGVLANDIILQVQYQKLDVRTIGNPRAVVPTPENLAAFMELAATEDEQRTNARALNPSLEKDFDLLWLWAHDENSARTTANPRT